MVRFPVYWAPQSCENLPRPSKAKGHLFFKNSEEKGPSLEKTRINGQFFAFENFLGDNERNIVKQVEFFWLGYGQVYRKLGTWGWCTTT